MAVDVSVVLVALLIHLIQFRAGLFALAAEPHPSTITGRQDALQHVHNPPTKVYLLATKPLLTSATSCKVFVTHYENSVTHHKVLSPPHKIFVRKRPGCMPELKTPQALIGNMLSGLQTFLDWSGKNF
jgi:hypothetical protein